MTQPEWEGLELSEAERKKLTEQFEVSFDDIFSAERYVCDEDEEG